MVLLVASLSKLYTKLENHHHHHFHFHHHDESEALSASLEAFRSDVSNTLSNHHLRAAGLEALSLSWFHEFFEVLPMINKAFGKLILKIEYPLRRWEGGSVEDYLTYTLHLLDLLNSITSSLSHMGHARLSLSHALSILDTSPDSALDHLNNSVHHLITVTNDCKTSFGGDDEKKSCSSSGSGKELVIHEALVVMKSVGYWVCGILLSGLSGDDRPYMEMREKAVGFVNSPPVDLDSWVCEMVRNRGGGGFVLKEVTEVKDGVDSLVSAMVGGEGRSEAEELQQRLERLEKMVDGLGKEVDALFSQILAGRNQLLDGLRPIKQ